MNIQSFFTGGTLRASMKNAELKQKFAERTQNQARNKPAAEKTEKQKQIEQIAAQMKDIRESNIISSIDTKLRTGAELTDSELLYLQKKNPELYKKAMDIKREREQYKRELKECRTKEDVERLNSRKTSQFLSEIKAVQSNPNIDEGKKRELLERIGRRAMAILKEHTLFIASKRYKDLPTEDEVRTGKKRKKLIGETDVHMKPETGMVCLQKELSVLGITVGEERKASEVKQTQKPEEKTEISYKA